MKKYIAIFPIVSLFFLFSCSGKEKASSVAEETVADSSTVVKDIFKGNLYYFHPTNDPAFCDLSKIIETDCGLGYFYFNKTGKVTFTFECVGDTSIEYFLGTYKVEKDRAICVFESYIACYFDTTETKFKANSGILPLEEKMDFELEFASCKNIYGFDNGAEKPIEKEYYVLEQVAMKESYFVDFFYSVKKLKPYF